MDEIIYGLEMFFSVFVSFGILNAWVELNGNDYKCIFALCVCVNAKWYAVV